jgi:hypothetical protein
MTSKRDRRGSHTAADRRLTLRHDPKVLGTVVARVMGRCDARLIDISRQGVLFESEARLLIGSKTTIRITTTDTSIAVTGTVVRSRVSTLGNAVVYQTALELDEELTLIRPSTSGDAVEAGESLKISSRKAAWLRVDEPGNIYGPDGDVLRSDEVEFSTTVEQDLDELQRRAGARPTIL